LIAEDVVFGLGGAVDLVVGIGLMLHELRCNFFGEEDLADVRGVAGGVGLVCFVAVDTDFEVDVVGAAHVEAREDGAKVYGAVWRSDLNATEEGELVRGMVFGWRAEALAWAWAIVRVSRVEVWWRPGRWSALRRARRASGPHGVLGGVAGVKTEGVAVPDVDGGVGERLAGARVEDCDAKFEGDALPVFDDVRAKEFVGDVVGADLLLGRELADVGVLQKAEGQGCTLQFEGRRESEGIGEEGAATECSCFFHVPRGADGRLIGVDAVFSDARTRRRNLFLATRC